VLFVLTKIPKGDAPTALILASVVAFGFHIVDGQNFG
jgi:hypothetical protein